MITSPSKPEFEAIPYCVWNNRGPSSMAVWLSERSDSKPMIDPATAKLCEQYVSRCPALRQPHRRIIAKPTMHRRRSTRVNTAVGVRPTADGHRLSRSIWAKSTRSPPDASGSSTRPVPTDIRLMSRQTATPGRWPLIVARTPPPAAKDTSIRSLRRSKRVTFVSRSMAVRMVGLRWPTCSYSEPKAGGKA